ncbi:MAG: ATP-binding protein [Bacillota bacterium]
MDTDLVVINSSNTLSEAREIFKKTFYSHLPVVDKQTQQFKGLLNYQQILAYTENERDDLQVGELTFPSPIVLSENDDLLKALKLADKISIKYLPVLDEKKEQLQGLISRSNIIEAYHDEVSGDMPEVDLDYAFHEEVDVERMINFALRPLVEQAEKKDIEIKIDLKEDLPPVSADSHRICWVITNLISDAIRYSDSGDEVLVSAYRKDDLVYISVTDNGPGIPEEYQEKIFDKYVQLSKEEEEEGKGLGLSISKEIIEEHGGNLWVESEVGVGTTFTFTLETLPEYKNDVILKSN